MCGNILKTIAATKRMEIETMRRHMPVETLREHLFDVSHKVISMRDSILEAGIAIIAEHKRRSPSKGEIRPMSDVSKVAESYERNGAAAMSVLTDTPYFGGSIADLTVARNAAPRLPLLRKEFIVDEYQIYQARIFGADAVLLIASMLNDDEIRRFNDLAHKIGLQTLVEIHSKEEIDKIPSDPDMIGINNRDLTSFSTDISNCMNIVENLPYEAVKIAESGIRNPEDIRLLKSIGFDGFLIGEAFMSTTDPGDTLRSYINKAKEYES